MTDLGDIARLAFGGDGAACLWWAALASLLVGKRLRAGRIALAAFVACWAYPIVMLAAAYDRTVALEALGYAIADLPRDAVWLAARFVGMVAVVEILWRARLALHGRRAAHGAEPRAA